VPAPYLATVLPLSDRVLGFMAGDRKRLSLEEAADVQLEIKARKRWIRAARSAYEAHHGVRIAPETSVES
jgi:hypothetical protein